MLALSPTHRVLVPLVSNIPRARLKKFHDSFAVGRSMIHIALVMFIWLSYLRRANVSGVCWAHGFVSNRIPIIK